MELTRLRGKELKKALLAGIIKVQDLKDELNKINIFPVPDGDTGTNLAETLAGGVNILIESSSLKLCEIVRRFAEAILFTSKGNSGTILSQFFTGFAEALKGKESITTSEFAEALKHATDTVYASLEKPVEGTIITVMREVAEYAVEISERERDFIKFLRLLLNKAEKSLARTPDLLPKLKEKGVVDSGAFGFVLILKGIVEYIDTGKIELSKVPSKETRKIIEEENIEHRYCTEAVIKSEGLDKKKLALILGALGSSLLIAGAGGLFKIHIHTNWPHKVFEALKGKGIILKQKIDDMIEMNLKARKKKFGVVVDSTADIPLDIAQEFGINIIPLQLIMNGKTYLEGIEIDKKQVLELLVEGKTRLSTSQPDPISIERTIKEALSKHEKIMIVTLSSQLSGTFNAIRIVASKHPNVYLFDGKMASLGTTLLALRALEKFEEGYDIENILEYLRKVQKKSLFILTLKTVKYLMKSGRISNLKGGIAELMQIKPIIAVNSEGKLENIGTALGEEKAFKKIVKIAKERLNPFQTYDFGIAYVGKSEFVERLEAFVRSEFSVRKLIVNEAGPLLSLHVGPGAYGLVALPVF
ncbi:MAG: DegV family protein [candidate division WOR-3 bacterium]